MNILSAEQFEPALLDQIFDLATHFKYHTESADGRRQLAARHVGELLINLFYEPSTRTRLSFDIAAQRLGLGVTGTENAELFSSVSKGETLEDTIRVLNQYHPSIIVLRHKETGAAAKAAAISQVPIINAGDGKGEHPTQALLDLYTIQNNKGRLNDLQVVIGGDLKQGRTARSLAKLLAHYEGNRIQFVSTSDLQIGQDVKDYLNDNQIEHSETSDMYSALRTADVVYWTRLQTERLAADQLLGQQFTLDQTALEALPSEAIIMHPLPRVGEIASTIDSDPRAKYFEQAGNGLYVRMALIDLVLSQSVAHP